MTKQIIIAALAGMIIMFILLKVIAKKPKTVESKTFENFKKVASTPEAKNLIKSSEFKKLIKTEQFQDFALDFGVEQLAEFIQV